MDNEHIKIWTRHTVPETYRDFLKRFDDDDGDGNILENTVFIAYIPKSFLDDITIKICCDSSNNLPPDLTRIFGDGFLCTNGIDVVEQPDGNGFVVVGGTI